jgi:23S rRNA (uracil1939-C5)-methyltransferase
MDAITIKVEKLVYGGEGLAHHAGKPVFVPFVLPGEVVEVFPVEESKKLIRALPTEIKEAAENRIAPECPYFTRCGGCHYQHLAHERQLSLKTDILRETLRRLGRIEFTGEIGVHLSPEPWQYRNRLQLKLAPHPVVADALEIGFHRAGSRTLCAVDNCPISSPKLNQLIRVLNRLSQQRALPRSLRSAEAFVDDRDYTFWLTLASPHIDFDPGALGERLRTEIDGLLSLQFHETATNRHRTNGLGWIYYQVGGHRYRVSHPAFFQSNRYLLPLLVERVLGGLEGKVAVELYAGVGLFTRALQERFARVVAVEADREAAADLAANLADGGEGVETLATTAADFLRRSPEQADVVLLDPPRAGLERGVAESLLELAPPRIIYLSCDPATLARDLARLASTPAGSPAYRLTDLELIDLFPQTFHIETLARLERQSQP